jgi:hypothetical protein
MIETPLPGLKPTTQTFGPVGRCCNNTSWPKKLRHFAPDNGKIIVPKVESSISLENELSNLSLTESQLKLKMLYPTAYTFAPEAQRFGLWAKPQPYTDILKNLVLNRMFYISHPSLASLECTINFLNYSEELFNHIFLEIIKWADFNPKQVEKKYSSFSITFKDVAAMKLLNIIFKGQEDHALYKIYQKWLGGSEILCLMDLTL